MPQRFFSNADERLIDHCGWTAGLTDDDIAWVWHRNSLRGGALCGENIRRQDGGRGSYELLAASYELRASSFELVARSW